MVDRDEIRELAGNRRETELVLRGIVDAALAVEQARLGLYARSEAALRAGVDAFDVTEASRVTRGTLAAWRDRRRKRRHLRALRGD